MNIPCKRPLTQNNSSLQNVILNCLKTHFRTVFVPGYNENDKLNQNTVQIDNLPRFILKTTRKRVGLFTYNLSLKLSD